MATAITNTHGWSCAVLVIQMLWAVLLQVSHFLKWWARGKLLKIYNAFISLHVWNKRFKASPGQIVPKTLSWGKKKKDHHKKRAGGMAHVVRAWGPESKPECCQRKKKNKWIPFFCIKVLHWPQKTRLKIKMESITQKFHVTKLKLSCSSDFPRN
jgi:hypothetical protein